MNTNVSNKIKVLIVDDSVVVRKLIATNLKRYDNIEVLDTAKDAYDARDKILKLKPDVLTLDIEMPKMDGITFLKKLMAYRPMPTVMVSSLTQEGSAATLQALEIGAIDFVAKPSTDSIGDADPFIKDLYQKIVMASVANVKISSEINIPRKVAKPSPLSNRIVRGSSDKIIAIGASTGGTEALKEVLTQMPKNAPGIVIVQHMPPIFTKRFAERLDNLSSIDVYEAEDGMSVGPGTALIAPGDFHMEVQKNGASYYVHTNQSERVNRHRPSVEVLFNSVSKCVKSNAVGVIMTGMGDDGAQGLLNMKTAGAKTIAQDEESCVVFGMPKAAIRIGAAGIVASLPEITDKILSLLR